MKTKSERTERYGAARTNRSGARKGTTQRLSIEAGAPGFGFQDSRPAAVVQRKLKESIDNGSRQSEQTERLSGLFGLPVQRMEGEQELQMKAEPATVQREAMEDEEPLQGRFETVQRQGLDEEEPLQGKFDVAQRQTLEDEEEPLQGKFETAQRQGPEEEEELLQGRFDTDAASVHLEAGAEHRENRTGMPDHLKAEMERLSGMDLSDVRVHRNSSKPAQLNALAYAQGNEIHLGPDQERHLPHEAWHVVQQRQGRVKPTIKMAGVPVNDNKELENEADSMGARAAAVPLMESIHAPVRRGWRTQRTSYSTQNFVGFDSTLSTSNMPDGFGHANSQQGDTVQRIGVVKLMGLQRDARAKHALMEKISIGIQTRYSRLSFIEKTDNPEQRAIKINMALAGKTSDVDPVNTAKILVPGQVNLGTLRLVLNELSSLPSVDPDSISEQAVKSFAHYTKEGYENVTGIARGGVRYDKGLKKDREMRGEEKSKGKETLGSLIENWADMPKFTGAKVYRIVHAETGEDALSEGGTWLKSNPTSTSVSLDWSRVEKGKICCAINIKGGSSGVKPVDTRAVSTYTHEGEILLPPGTTFKKVKVKGDYTIFDADMPSDVTAMKTDLIE